MSNSPLVSYTKISPNKTSPRRHSIDTITIHCVVGQLSAESIGNIFVPPSRKASSNYGIGTDGRIGMYVEEKDRSWCSSSASNDHRAITIECASDKTDPYAINDKVYASLIELCADICKRNGIKELKWKADKSLIGHPDKQNMTVHRWFDNKKSCPGDYIYERLGKIAAEVNAKLGSEQASNSDDVEILYRVQTGAFSNKTNAEKMRDKVEAAGFSTYMVLDKGLYKIQVGAFKEKVNAEAMAAKLTSAGFSTFIVSSSNTEPHKEDVSNSSILYRVQTGAFSNKIYAEELRDRIRAVGFTPFLVEDNGLFKVQVGAFENKANAEAMSAKLTAAGFNNFIVSNEGKHEHVNKVEGYPLTAFVRDIQATLGASVDGIAGPETLSKTVTLSAKINNKHQSVFYVQKRLKELGYSEVGTVDGSAGPKFTSAVAHFQMDNGCTVDGEITARNKTWKKLLGMV